MSGFKKIFGFFVVSMTISCATDEGLTDMEDVESEETLTTLELEFLEEYEYVTFNFAPDSFGADVNEKWGSDVKLFLDGSFSESYEAEVQDALTQFNGLLDDGISFQLVATLEESNIHLIFGEIEAIQEVWPDMFDAIGDTAFQGYALYNRDFDFNIIRGRIWVKNASIPLFRHELGHNIGLGHSSGNFCERNFSRNQSFMCSFLKEDFSLFDEAIIKTLYNPKIEVGLPFSQLKPIVEELLLTDKIVIE